MLIKIDLLKKRSSTAYRLFPKFYFFGLNVLPWIPNIKVLFRWNFRQFRYLTYIDDITYDLNLTNLLSN